jgi:arylsulfatase
MSDERKQSMFVVAYKGRNTADQVYDTLRDLQKEKKVKIKTAVVVARMADGRLKLVHKKRITVGKGAVGGGLLGLLIFGTGGGLIAGAVVGALIGSTRSGQRATLKDFLDDKLGQDESALAILVSDADWEAIRAATEQVYGRGEVLAMELTPEAEAKLNALAANEEVAAAVAEEVEVEDDPEVEVVEESS